MADPTRPPTLSDLWLPGDVLGGAMLEGWSGPWQVKVHDGAGHAWRLWWDTDGLGHIATRLDCRRPEVRDRAVRVIGPDLLPIHAAELRGEITADEAAGLVWCSVLRREAGLGVVHVLDAWADGDPRPGWFTRKPLTNHGGFISHDICWVSLGADESSGRETGEAGRAAADAAALTAGYALREPDGILLLPLPGGVVGRLDTNA